MAAGYATRTGTLELTNAAGSRCKGDFAYYRGHLEGHGIIACDDGQRATIQFVGPTSASGYGGGTSSNGNHVRLPGPLPAPASTSIARAT